MTRKAGKTCLALLPIVLFGAAPAHADERIRFVHSFATAYGSAGLTPNAVVGHQTTADPASWALYGTTYFGGVGYGMVYKLAPPSAGNSRWTETRLYVFNTTLEGLRPNGPLLFDTSGNAYGVTQEGGTIDGRGAVGTVFRLSPPKPGQFFWNRTTLHAFSDGPDGGYPYGDLTTDASGALYGVSRDGDGYPYKGAVFKLTPPTGQGAWSFSVLHNFTVGVGGQVGTALAADPSGALYGITDGDAATECPQFYKLTPPAAGGTWSFANLYAFSCDKRGYNYLLRDPAGDFYGTRAYPGSGEVFRLRPPAPGKTAWTETVLHTFSGADGDYPLTLSRIDNSGSIYGATADRLPRTGGGFLGGVVFRLDPPVGGAAAWRYTQVAITSQNSQTNPSGQLVRDPGGAIYTSMSEGGPRASDPSTQGAVFRIEP